jgi:hypothetical protein
LSTSLGTIPSLNSTAKRRPERQLPVIQSAAMDLDDEAQHHPKPEFDRGRAF